MYLAIPPRQTCAAAWLEATERVSASAAHEANNVVIDISTPLRQTAADAKVIASVDTFLTECGKQPLQTVANTIFPDALYRMHGAPQFIKKFNDEVLPRIRKKDRWSGYYFERMTSYLGKDGSSHDLLWNIVERIRDDGNKSLNKFELSLFDPERDVDNSPYGGQCLSFLSFKLTHGTSKRLMLTAMYRNHYYIEKLLGNLIGLSRLMAFVAKEGGVGIGELTIVSTHATVDVPRDTKRSEINDLLSVCRSAY